jgi:hypothetical protein
MTDESPAAKAVRLLGAKRIAAVCDLTTNAVWKWSTQGAGRIPAKHQPAVLDLARRQDVAFTASDCIGSTS